MCSNGWTARISRLQAHLLLPRANGNNVVRLRVYVAELHSLISNMNASLHKHREIIATGLLCALCAGILGFRFFYTESRGYAFMAWNLFLAILPWLFLRAADFMDRGRSWWATWGFLGAGFFFLPNAPYMVTDLFHLRWGGRMPIWYDTLLIFTFAIAGLVLFYFSLDKMEAIVRRKLKGRWHQVIIPAVIFLCAFGVYLGRYLRFNSWDLLDEPFHLFGEIADRVVDPLAHPRTWGVTVGYGLLLLIGYWTLKLLRQPRGEIASQ